LFPAVLLYIVYWDARFRRMLRLKAERGIEGY
jgi:hypothetical protein